MKFGMNLLLWTGEMSDGILPVLESLKEMGFDGVEVPLFNLEMDYASWGRRLDQLGLERTAVTVRGVEDNPISPDPAVRAKGVENNRRALDCCHALGATALVGPYHSALGFFSGQGPTHDEWNWGVESMQKVAEHAGKAGVTLGVEPRIAFQPMQPGDVQATYADIGRIRAKINFNPSTPLEVGIPRFVEWYRGYHRLADHA